MLNADVMRLGVPRRSNGLCGAYFVHFWWAWQASPKHRGVRGGLADKRGAQLDDAVELQLWLRGPEGRQMYAIEALYRSSMSSRRESLILVPGCESDSFTE